MCAKGCYFHRPDLEWDQPEERIYLRLKHNLNARILLEEARFEEPSHWFAIYHRANGSSDVLLSHYAVSELFPP